MLAHAEIVIGTPDNDIALTIRAVIAGMGVPAGKPFQLNKMPVPALTFQPVQLVPEFLAIVQVKRLRMFMKMPRTAQSNAVHLLVKQVVTPI